MLRRMVHHPMMYLEKQGNDMSNKHNYNGIGKSHSLLMIVFEASTTPRPSAQCRQADDTEERVALQASDVVFMKISVLTEWIAERTEYAK